MSSWSKSLSFLLQVWDLLLSPEAKPGCHFVLVEKNYWHEEILFILFLVLQLQPQSKKRSGHRWEWNYFSHEIGLSPASLWSILWKKCTLSYWGSYKLWFLMDLATWNAPCLNSKLVSCLGEYFMNCKIS